MHCPPFIVLLIWSWFLAGQVAIAEVDYLREIRPLLAEKCGACHGVLRQEAGLRLDHGQLLRRGSDEGPVVDVEHVSNSKLLLRVTSQDSSLRMPPETDGEPLTQDQIHLLSEWIVAGAPSPDDEAIPVGPDDHWAWQRPDRPAVPAIEDDGWCENPLDAFILAKLREHRLNPTPSADRRTLLRRLYFDLIGLPPSVSEQRRFLADDSPHAWTDAIERLLASPAYGERWARHWMDVWRYSDWDGYNNELRGSQRHIWRWRDWTIESLNADQGYDQMILEMLAGDELAPSDDRVLRATGFLARNYHNSNRNIWLDATVEHTAKAFLGLTINCARCHDHKYDPLRQTEYYAFRAIFEPYEVRTERVPGQRDTLKDGLARVFDAKPDVPTYVYLAGNEKQPDKDHPVAPAVPAVFGVPLEVDSVRLPNVAVFPALRGTIEREEMDAAEHALAEAENALAKVTPPPGGDSEAAHPDENVEWRMATQAVAVAVADLASLRARWAADKARFATANGEDLDATRRLAVLAEHRAKLEKAKLIHLRKQAAFVTARIEEEKEGESSKAIMQARQELDAAQQELERLTAPPSEDAQYTSVGESYPAESTGRRLALAQWIVRAENPLTARVAVNYVWMHHFGEPLVANVFDFGLRSPSPPHQQLLDWLACELVEHHWSLKHLHRLILNSRTYRMASSSSDPATADRSRRIDPDNGLLWRANVRRLEAEAVRDSLLHVGGNLSRQCGGPDIDFREGEIIPRRSIYFRHAYEKQMTMLVLFDAAAPTECYRRNPSIIPQQALALANSPLSFDQSRALARTLAMSSTAIRGSAQGANADAFIHAAFESVLCRACTTEELQVCREFLTQQTELLSHASRLTPLPGKAAGQTLPAPVDAQRARENLIHTLMNHNDFITIR